MAMATTASCTGPTVDLMPLRRRGLHYTSKWNSTTSPFSVDELSDFPRPLGLCDGLYCPPPTRSSRSVQQSPSAPPPPPQPPHPPPPPPHPASPPPVSPPMFLPADHGRRGRRDICSATNTSDQFFGGHRHHHRLDCSGPTASSFMVPRPPEDTSVCLVMDVGTPIQGTFWRTASPATVCGPTSA